MKDKPNEWVSISDLMSGVTAVVMLLLVVSVVRNAATSVAAAAQQRKGITSAIQGIQESLASSDGVQGVVVRDSVLLLSDQSFESGSACLSKPVREILETRIAPILAEKLKHYPNLSVQIEGHTDAANVHGLAIDLNKKCALFDDNYSLSAGRAREARKAVLIATQGDTAIGRRIAVVGYGPDRLVNTNDPTAPENRRVEIRLVTRQL